VSERGEGDRLKYNMGAADGLLSTDAETNLNGGKEGKDTTRAEQGSLSWRGEGETEYQIAQPRESPGSTTGGGGSSIQSRLAVHGGGGWEKKATDYQKTETPETRLKDRKGGEGGENHLPPIGPSKKLSCWAQGRNPLTQLKGKRENKKRGSIGKGVVQSGRCRNLKEEKQGQRRKMSSSQSSDRNALSRINLRRLGPREKRGGFAKTIPRITLQTQSGWGGEERRS